MATPLKEAKLYLGSPFARVVANVYSARAFNGHSNPCRERYVHA
jgi:hypothetical protein